MLKSTFDDLLNLWSGLKGLWATPVGPDSVFLGHTQECKGRSLEREPPNFSQVTDEPPGSCKPPLFALETTHSSCTSCKTGTRRRKSWEGPAHIEKASPEKSYNQQLARRDPFLLNSLSQKAAVFISSSPVVWVAIFPTHSNRNCTRPGHSQC